MKSLVDVDLYDPISKRTYSGKNSWCEVGEDYLVYGSHQWGQDITDSKTPVKYWVHRIQVTERDLIARPVPFIFKRGHPVLVQTKTESFPGIIDTCSAETKDSESMSYMYSFVIVPIEMLSFVELLNTIVTQGIEHEL